MSTKYEVESGFDESDDEALSVPDAAHTQPIGENIYALLISEADEIPAIILKCFPHKQVSRKQFGCAFCGFHSVFSLLVLLERSFSALLISYRDGFTKATSKLFSNSQKVTKPNEHGHLTREASADYVKLWDGTSSRPVARAVRLAYSLLLIGFVIFLQAGSWEFIFYASICIYTYI